MKVKWYNIIGMIGIFFFALFIFDTVVLVDNASCVSVPDVFIPNLISLFFPIIFLACSFIWIGAEIQDGLDEKN